jgi:hypothetical protein
MAAFQSGRRRRRRRRRRRGEGERLGRPSGNYRSFPLFLFVPYLF